MKQELYLVDICLLMCRNCVIWVSLWALKHCLTHGAPAAMRITLQGHQVYFKWLCAVVFLNMHSITYLWMKTDFVIDKNIILESCLKWHVHLINSKMTSYALDKDLNLRMMSSSLATYMKYTCSILLRFVWMFPVKCLSQKCKILPEETSKKTKLDWRVTFLYLSHILLYKYTQIIMNMRGEFSTRHLCIQYNAFLYKTDSPKIGEVYIKLSSRRWSFPPPLIPRGPPRLMCNGREEKQKAQCCGTSWLSWLPSTAPLPRSQVMPFLFYYSSSRRLTGERCAASAVPPCRQPTLPNFSTTTATAAQQVRAYGRLICNMSLLLMRGK